MECGSRGEEGGEGGVNVRGLGVDGDAHRDKGVGMSLSGPYLLEFWFEQITIVWFLNVEMYINSNSNVSPGLVSN